VPGGQSTGAPLLEIASTIINMPNTTASSNVIMANFELLPLFTFPWQQFLYFLPLPHLHGSFRFSFFDIIVLGYLNEFRLAMPSMFLA